MQERSLRVYADKTFFTRITNTITKMLIPTKIGINGMMISIKRNNLLKIYESYIQSEHEENAQKKASSKPVSVEETPEENVVNDEEKNTDLPSQEEPKEGED